MWRLYVHVTFSRESERGWIYPGLEMAKIHVVMGKGADARTSQNTFPFYSQRV